MNYRHVFHAGGIADLFKHATLLEILRRLQAKPTPLCVLETHAGAGLYDLTGEAAARTGEAAAGIRQLWQASDLPASLAPLRDAVAACNQEALSQDASSQEDHPRYYPGAPRLLANALRPIDRLIACELHPEDAGLLKRALADYPQAAVHARDGYSALKPFLPPKEKRGLIHMDPPFEVADEWERLAAAVIAARQRFPGGVFALWLPVKDRTRLAAFHGELRSAGLGEMCLAEFCPEAEDHPDRLSGSQMLLINPPWQIELWFAEALPALAQALACPGARYTVWQIDHGGHSA